MKIINFKKLKDFVLSNEANKTFVEASGIFPIIENVVLKAISAKFGGRVQLEKARVVSRIQDALDTAKGLDLHAELIQLEETEYELLKSVFADDAGTAFEIADLKAVVCIADSILEAKNPEK